MIGEVPAFRIDHMPYGGVKDSGLGREGLRYAIEEMTEPRLMALTLRVYSPHQLKEARTSLKKGRNLVNRKTLPPPFPVSADSKGL